MKAEIYEVKVCNSALEKVHGYFQTIREIYIPSKKITFNEDRISFHCFSSNRSRYNTDDSTKIGEIEVPKAMVLAMINYTNASKRMKKTKQWFKRCVINKGMFDESCFK